MARVETEKIFMLDSKKSFRMAERFKSMLEKEGSEVKVIPYGLHGVRITGWKKIKEVV
jgi:hypothetical protein